MAYNELQRICFKSRTPVMRQRPFIRSSHSRSTAAPDQGSLPSKSQFFSYVTTA
jgi:hypothetical protein